MEDEEFFEKLQEAAQADTPENILNYLRSDDKFTEDQLFKAEEYLSTQTKVQEPSYKGYDVVEEEVVFGGNDDDEFESRWISDNPNEIQKVINSGIASGILAKLIDKGSTDFEKISYYNRILQENQPKEGDVLYSDSLIGGFALDVLRTVPQSFISMGVAAPSALTEIGAGALAGGAIPIPGIGSLTGALAGFAGGTSYAIEYANAVMSSLQEAGVDTTNEEALSAAFSNPSIMKKARLYANKRGIPIALFDAVSGGSGGKIAGAVAKSSRKSLGLKIGEALPSAVKRKAVLAEVGAQSLLGGSGELSGQVISGDEIDVRDILLESFAELAPASPSILAEYVKSRKQEGEPSGSEQTIVDLNNKINEENKNASPEDRLSDEQREELSDEIVSFSEDFSQEILSDDKEYQTIDKRISITKSDLNSPNIPEGTKELLDNEFKELQSQKNEIKSKLKERILSLSLTDFENVQTLSREYKQRLAASGEYQKQKSIALMDEIKSIIFPPEPTATERIEQAAREKNLQQKETNQTEKEQKKLNTEARSDFNEIEREKEAQKKQDSENKAQQEEKIERERLTANINQPGVFENKEGIIKIDSENENTIVFETEDEIIEIGQVKDEQGNDQVDLVSDKGITLGPRIPETPKLTSYDATLGEFIKTKKSQQERIERIDKEVKVITEERDSKQLKELNKTEKDLNALKKQGDRDLKEAEALFLEEMASKEKNKDLVQVKENIFQVVKKKDGSFTVSKMREDGKLVGIKDEKSRQQAINKFKKEKTETENRLIQEADNNIKEYEKLIEEDLDKSTTSKTTALDSDLKRLESLYKRKIELIGSDESSNTKDLIIEFLDEAIRVTSTRGNAYDATLGIPLFMANNSLKVVRAAYLAGKSLAQAIDDGIKYIRKQGSTVDKVKYDKFISDNINQVKRKRKPKKKKSPKKRRAISRKPTAKPTPASTTQVKETTVSEDGTVTTSQTPGAVITLEKKGKYAEYLSIFRRSVIDKYEDIIQLQNKVLESVGRLSLSSDFKNALSTLDGKVQDQLKKIINPLEIATAEAIKKSGKTLDQIDQIATAFFAQDRNKSILEKTKNSKNVNTEGSGMSDKKAQEILEKELGFTKEQAQNPNLKNADKKIRDAIESIQDINKARRDILVKTGLVSQEQVSQWAIEYPNYIPLSGFANLKENKIVRTQSGRGFKVFNQREAKGRESESGDAVSESINNLQNTIIEGNKNKVLQRLFNLVKENPIVGADGESVWSVLEPKNKEQLSSLNAQSNEKDSGVLRVMINGESKFIQFSDPRMAETMKGTTVFDPGDMKPIIRYVAGLNRFLSSMITTYDPEFIFRNFARDIQAGLFNLVGEETNKGGVLNEAKVKGLAGKVLSGVLPSIKAIYNVEGKKTKDLNTKEKYYTEFVADGGKTEWFYSRSPEEFKSNIKNLVEGNKESSIKAAKDFAERVNTSVENGIRLSSYIEAREAGVSREKAAELAKELTVNFNRSGEYGTTINSLYLFFNASIQGTNRLVKTLKPQFEFNEKTGKKQLKVTNSQKLAAGLAVFGGVMSIINESMSEDDDDGESYYSKIPEFVRERNLIIMNPLSKKKGDYVKVPLPYGLNVFYVIGNSLMNANQGITDKGEVLGDIFTASLGSFSPLNFPSYGSDATSYIFKVLAPTLGQPIISLVANENFFGRTIYSKENPWSKSPRPASELGRDRFKNLESWTKALNKASGGSEFRPGAIDLNPDKMGFVFEWFTGGAGKTIGRTQRSLRKVTEGELPETRDIPFYRIFMGQTNDYQDRSEYYNNVMLINQLTKEAESGQLNKKDKISVSRMKYISKDVSSRLRKIRKLKDKTENAERQEYLENLEKAQMLRFKKSFKKLNIEDIK